MNSGYTYEVENEIDFFKELKKITADKAAITAPLPEHNSDSYSIPRCLITDEKLRKDHITLECGHKFNYIPLFKDVLFQKCSLLPKNISSNLVTTYTKHAPNTSTYTTTSSPTLTSYGIPAYPINNSQSSNPTVLSVTYNSSYNLETMKLQYNQTKCPYCRSITPYILPYYPYPDVCKVKYVNTPSNLALPAMTCEYAKFISGENTVFTTSEYTGCRSHCIYNEKYDLMLCNKHFSKLESGFRLSISTSQKTSSSAPSSPSQKRSRVGKKNPTINNNEDTNVTTQNIIVSHHNPATTVCLFTLLSGPRKGCPCGKPMWIPKSPSSTNAIHDAGSAAYCKAHYNKGVMISNIQ